MEGHPVQQRVWWSKIIIVSGRQRGIQVLPQGWLVVGPFIRQIAKVRDKAPILKQVLATGYVIVPGLRVFPPGLSSFVMYSPVGKGHPRQ